MRLILRRVAISLRDLRHSEIVFEYVVQESRALRAALLSEKMKMSMS